MSKITYYFVEGECEKKFLDVLKSTSIQLIVSGRVCVFNVIKDVFPRQRLLTLKRSANIILVYDTDVRDSRILEKNIQILRKHNFKNIYHIQSINNFEQELLYATSLNNINEMYNTAGESEFKKCFLHDSNLWRKLNKVNYNHEKMWSRLCFERPFNQFDASESTKFIKPKEYAKSKEKSLV